MQTPMVIRRGATNQTFADELAIKIKDTSSYGMPQKLGTMSMGVHIGETYTDYSQGNFRVTDNATDFALDGDGFFAIAYTDKAGNTSVKYSRDGAFVVNTAGYLVTKDGDYVLNQNGAMNADAGARIQVDPNVPITVDEKGNIFQNNQQVGTIGVVDIADYNYLAKYGENMYDLVNGGARQGIHCESNAGMYRIIQYQCCFGDGQYDHDIESLSGWTEGDQRCG